MDTDAKELAQKNSAAYTVKIQANCFIKDC